MDNILIFENQIVDEVRTVPVHRNMTGYYECRTGVARHLIVALIHAVGWTLYEGWTSPEMSIEDAVEIIGKAGDKMYNKDTIAAASKKLFLQEGKYYD